MPAIAVSMPIKTGRTAGLKHKSAVQQITCICITCNENNLVKWRSYCTPRYNAYGGHRTTLFM